MVDCVLYDPCRWLYDFYFLHFRMCMPVIIANCRLIWSSHMQDCELFCSLSEWFGSDPLHPAGGRRGCRPGNRWDPVVGLSAATVRGRTGCAFLWRCGACRDERQEGPVRAQGSCAAELVQLLAQDP